MIPKVMQAFLRERLPERTWQNRLRREDGSAYLEFGPLDIEQLGRLGIGNGERSIARAPTAVNSSATPLSLWERGWG